MVGRVLSADNIDLAPGRYARTDVVPGVSFEVEDGWSSGPFGGGSVQVRHDAGDGEVVVTIGYVTPDRRGGRGPVGSIPGITVHATSESLMSGLTGPNLELENPSGVRTSMLPTASGDVGLDGGDRAWLSLFDTADGVLAIAVTSDAATWDAALLEAEPLLESVVIEG